jgi:hypothetical protein
MTRDEPMRKDRSVTIALCVSMMVHAAILLVLTEREIRQLARLLYHPPTDVRWYLLGHARAVAPADKKIAETFDELFGEHGGIGKASSSSPGELPMLARQAEEEQASLTPNPGPPADAAERLRRADAADAAAARVAVASPAVVQMPFGPPLERESPFGTPTVRATALPTTRPVMMATTAPATRPVQLASTADVMAPHVAESANAPAAPSPALASAHAATGEPGHKSESEVDPFSTSPSFTYRNGKVEARDGRKVKTVRPRLTDAGWQDLLKMDDPKVSFVVHIDESGKVTDVDYLHRSGFDTVDVPTFRCLYEWEFEPSRDRAGHPKRDSVIITLAWR